MSRRMALIIRQTSYEHQSPLASVRSLIGLHLPGPGLPVVPHARQIQWPPCSSTKISRQGWLENCVQQPENVQLAGGTAAEVVLVGSATPEVKKQVKRTSATAKSLILRKVIRQISFLIQRVIVGLSGHAGRLIVSGGAVEYLSKRVTKTISCG